MLDTKKRHMEAEELLAELESGKQEGEIIS